MTYRWRPTELRGLARATPHRLLTPVRRRAYTRDASWIGRLPQTLRRRAGLEDVAAQGSRKVEIGSGRRPTPGYIHADTDPWSRHVELVIRNGKVPLPDAWAEEILAIHVLEHIHPRHMLGALREWRRCLQPGGMLQVHVPDSRKLCRQFVEEADIGRKWALMGALNGMYANARLRSPEQLSRPSDHQVFFDADLLRWALESAGYVNVTDRTGELTDVHTEGWAALVPQISLIFQARRP